MSLVVDGFVTEELFLYFVSKRTEKFYFIKLLDVNSYFSVIFNITVKSYQICMHYFRAMLLKYTRLWSTILITKGENTDCGQWFFERVI